jgi:hypothetical protein
MEQARIDFVVRSAYTRILADGAGRSDASGRREVTGVKSMRTPLLAAFFVIALAGGIERAVAEPYYPWCAELRDRDGMSTNCGFTTFQQCMATVSGVGGFCRENSFNRQWSAEQAQPRKSKRRQAQPH